VAKVRSAARADRARLPWSCRKPVSQRGREANFGHATMLNWTAKGFVSGIGAITVPDFVIKLVNRTAEGNPPPELQQEQKNG